MKTLIRAVPAYYLGFDAPDALRTALMLRQGIWRKEDPGWHICGIPDVFYTDNGSDYRSKHMEPVSADEARLILEHKWQELGTTFDHNDFTDREAAAAVIRITGGNFR